MRSNYFQPANIRFYEYSLKLWERLEQELNFNAMVSQRGTLNLFHTEAQRDLFTRRANQMRLLGVDAEAVTRERVKALVPLVDLDNGRYPVLGGFLQPRGGTVRHDAVAWGYARGASERGVDIIEHCEVTGIRREGGRVTGVESRRGFIGADIVCLAVAGHSSHLAAMAGLRLPIETHVLQAWVSEGLKPVLDVVLTYGAGHFYVSQSDKGGLVFGGAIDGYNTYGQRGTLPMAEEVTAAAVTLLPGLARVQVLRQWGGVMDMSMDGSPIISQDPGGRADPQWRLVLRRLQGHSRRRHDDRAPDRQPALRTRLQRTWTSGASPPAARSMSAASGPFPTRTEGPCCASPVPCVVSVTRRSSATAAMQRGCARGSRRGWTPSMPTSTSATTRSAGTPSGGCTSPAAVSSSRSSATRSRTRSAASPCPPRRTTADGRPGTPACGPAHRS